jgi:L,D-transpeptidase catalytic domain
MLNRKKDSKLARNYLVLLTMKVFYRIIFIFLCVGCESTPKTLPSLDINKTKEMAQKALLFCKANKMNTHYCILIDMSLHSGVNRMVIWDFAQGIILKRMLVGHGCGTSAWGQDGTKDKPIFSNAFDSHCSSLGKYKLGVRAPSDWGIKIKYVMQGLETTNNNAQNRFVVFHGWDAMSDNEVFPQGSPEGWGCPTISNNNMKWIDSLLRENAGVLMWIYE